MIRSPGLQRFLLVAAQKTDAGIGRVFHEVVRLIYLGPVLLFLSRVLRPKGISSDKFELIARHSSTSASDFNAFMSDLDLSAVLPDEMIEYSSEVVRRFFYWKRKLPFIGELELYSRSELEELQKTFIEPNGVYPSIRRVRKLSWMENLLPNAVSEYHRFKAERSISKILSKEEIDYAAHRTDYRILFSKRVQAWIDTSFKNAIANEANYGFESLSSYTMFQSDYFSTKIWTSLSHVAQPGEVSLSPAHAWILVALTPRASFDDPKINSVVTRLRTEPTVREQWTQISRIEVLVYCAVLRAQESVTEGERNWLQGFIDSWSLGKAPL